MVFRQCKQIGDKMAYKNQNYIRNYLLKEEADKFQKDYVDPNQEQKEEVQEEQVVRYSFTSYSDAEGTTTWGTGVVEVIESKENFTKVKVIENTPNESFVNNIFYIQSDAKTDGTLYQLYTDEGETSANIYVSISTVQTTNN